MEKNKIKIYLASSMSKDKREYIAEAAKTLRKRGFETYVPMENSIPNAWDYPNSEWGLMVFTEDVSAIDRSDFVVMLNYGRTQNTSGCTWEAGYAFGTGKKVIVVDIMDDAEETSLMIENGRYSTLNGIRELETYDFESLPIGRTLHKQS